MVFGHRIKFYQNGAVKIRFSVRYYTAGIEQTLQNRNRKEWWTVKRKASILITALLMVGMLAGCTTGDGHVSTSPTAPATNGGTTGGNGTGNGSSSVIPGTDLGGNAGDIGGNGGDAGSGNGGAAGSMTPSTSPNVGSGIGNDAGSSASPSASTSPNA